MDLLTEYADAVHRNQQRVEAIKSDQLGDPTPCTQWDVRTLLDHIIGGYRMFAAALGEAPPPEDGDLSTAHRVAGEAAVAAFRSPGALERSVALAVGTVPGTNALGLALTDAVVHGWDLATATGQDTSIDEGVAAALLAGAEQAITADMRQPDGAMPVFAPPVAVGSDHPAGERLIAFLGRRP